MDYSYEKLSQESNKVRTEFDQYKEKHPVDWSFFNKKLKYELGMDRLLNKLGKIGKTIKKKKSMDYIQWREGNLKGVKINDLLKLLLNKKIRKFRKGYSNISSLFTAHMLNTDNYDTKLINLLSKLNIKYMPSEKFFENIFKELRQEYILTLEKLPKDIIKEGGFGKLIKVLIGVILHNSSQYMHIYETKGNEDAEKFLTKIIKVGYCFGEGYPLFDDIVLDSDKYLSPEQKTLVNNAILKTLSGQENVSSENKYGKLIIETINTMKQIMPYNTHKELYDLFKSSALAQVEDSKKNKPFDYNAYSIKAGSMRLLPKVIGKQDVTKSDLHDILLKGTLGQMMNDVSGYKGDRENNVNTPLTRKDDETEENLKKIFSYVQYVYEEHNAKGVMARFLNSLQSISKDEKGKKLLIKTLGNIIDRNVMNKILNSSSPFREDKLIGELTKGALKYLKERKN